VFSSCQIASIILRQIASPALSPASASSSATYRALYIRLVAVNASVSDWRRAICRFPGSRRQVIGRTSMQG